MAQARIQLDFGFDRLRLEKKSISVHFWTFGDADWKT